jgi:hypothetical protein
MLNERVKVKMGTDFPVIPMDKYTVQITNVDKKTKIFSEQETPGLNYELTVLDNKTMEVDGSPELIRGRKLWYWVSLNLTPRSNLGKLISAVQGRDLTKEELKDIDDNGFDGDSLVEHQIDVFVELVDGKGPSSGKQFNNVTSVAKCGKELTGFDPKERPQEGVVTNKTESVVSNNGDSTGFLESLEKDK